MMDECSKGREDDMVSYIQWTGEVIEGYLNLGRRMTAFPAGWTLRSPVGYAREINCSCERELWVIGDPGD